VIQNGVGTIALNNDIFTSNDVVEFLQTVQLAGVGDRIIDTSANPGTGLGGTIRFLGGIQGGAKSLTLTTPGITGDVQVDGSITAINALTISNARNVELQNVNATGAVNITAQGTATLAATLQSGAVVTLNVDDLVLSGSINAGGNDVRIRPATNSRAITFGGAGGLAISDAELDQISTTGMLIVGANSHGGTITIAGAISPANVGGGFTIATGANIVDSDAATSFAIDAGNLTLRAGTGIGTLASPIDITGGTVSARNTTSGGIYLRAPNGNMTVAGTGVRNDAGEIWLTANEATSGQTGTININAPITGNGRIVMRAADDLTIEAPVDSNGGDIFIIAGNASGMNISGISPASETADNFGGVTIKEQILAGSGNITINATESVVQSPQPPANSGGGAAGLQNSGNLVVRTYNNAAGVGIIDLRHDDNLTGNSNGPITLETLNRNGSDYASSNIDYRSYGGVVISGIGTSADFVAIAKEHNIDLDALNIQARNLTLIANDGNVNVHKQITSAQINGGNDGGSLNLLAGSRDVNDPGKGNVNIYNVSGKKGITIGRFKTTGDSKDDFDPDTGLLTPDAIEKFNHDLKLVAQNDINIEGSIYLKGDLNLRADASRREATRVGATPAYGNGMGSVRISVPNGIKTPVVVRAENIVVGTLDAQDNPLPVQHLILTAGNITPTSGKRRSTSASLEAVLDLDVFLTGNLELTGGDITASNLPDASSKVENTAAATIGGNVVTILGVSSKDVGAVNYHPDAPPTNGSNITLKGGTADATRTGANDGTAKADASALILSATTAKIDIGGDITIGGGTANATGSLTTAVAVAGTEIGAQVTGKELLNIVARDMYITGGTRTATDGGIADGFGSLASSGAIHILLKGDKGLTFAGGAGSGLFDAMGSSLIRVTGTGYPITLVGRIQPLDYVVDGQDGLIVAGAPLVDESLLAAFLRATEAARQDSLPQDPNLQSGSKKGPAGVCK
jgi:hypothetical protein